MITFIVGLAVGFAAGIVASFVALLAFVGSRLFKGIKY